MLGTGDKAEETDLSRAEQSRAETEAKPTPKAGNLQMSGDGGCAKGSRWWGWGWGFREHRGGTQPSFGRRDYGSSTHC